MAAGGLQHDAVEEAAQQPADQADEAAGEEVDELRVGAVGPQKHLRLGASEPLGAERVPRSLGAVAGRK